MKMEILLDPTITQALVCDIEYPTMGIKHVTNGKQRWVFDPVNQTVPGLRIDGSFLETPLDLLNKLIMSTLTVNILSNKYIQIQRTEQYIEELNGVLINEKPILILEIQARRFFLRWNLPDHSRILTIRSKDGDGDSLVPCRSIHHPLLTLNAVQVKTLMTYLR
ncbi:hypothetical protein Tco_1336669 [Tanacetum coccineum]